MKNVKIIRARLQRISKDADLFNPESVEKLVYSLNANANYKNKLLEAYRKFTESNGIEWKKPKRLREEEFPIKIPSEHKIDLIISSCSKTYALVFRLSKYGLRPDEIAKITLRDVDLERGELTVRSSKMGAQRVLKLKQDVIDLLKEHIAKRRIEDLNKKLFASVGRIKRKWRENRQLAYEKFRDLELLKIRLYDLRHWFATMTYIKTRDIFHVKYALGHRSIKNTLRYVHLAECMITYPEDYVSAVARTVEEACSLVEAGFEYVTEMDGVKIFRKRK